MIVVGLDFVYGEIRFLAFFFSILARFGKLFMTGPGTYGNRVDYHALNLIDSRGVRNLNPA